MKIKTNFYKNDLYCCECKGRISKGEKYALVAEELYDDQVLYKEHHLGCVPETEEDYWDNVNTSLDNTMDSEEG